MALIVEDGSIVELADTYVSLADAVARATRQGNLTFGDLDVVEQQEPALRVAFDYLNQRWIHSWKGLRIRSTDLGNGVGVTADDLALAASQISSSVTDLSVFDGTSIIRIVGSAADDGDYHVTGTPTATTIDVTETFVGELAGASIAIDGVLLEQTGAWPRAGVYTPEGVPWDVTKIPADIVNAQIEYAFIAANQALTLTPTPTVDATGRPLTKLEQGVGPLKQVKEWGEGVVTPIVTRSYPTADNFVKRWIAGAGSVVR